MMMMKKLIGEAVDMVSYILIQGLFSLDRRWLQHNMFNSHSSSRISDEEWDSDIKEVSSPLRSYTIEN